MHGQKTALPQGSVMRDGVQVEVVSGNGNVRQAQLFQQELEDLITPAMPRGQAPAYMLKVTLNETVNAVGVARDGTASRYNLVMDSNYMITRADDPKPLTSGAIRHVASFNNPNNQYFSTYISEQDARKRGVAELAEMYRQRLIGYTPNMLVPAQPSNTAPPPVISPLINENRTQNY